MGKSVLMEDRHGADHAPQDPHDLLGIQDAVPALGILLQSGALGGIDGLIDGAVLFESIIDTGGPGQLLGSQGQGGRLPPALQAGAESGGIGGADLQLLTAGGTDREILPDIHILILGLVKGHIYETFAAALHHPADQIPAPEEGAHPQLLGAVAPVGRMSAVGADRLRDQAHTAITALLIHMDLPFQVFLSLYGHNFSLSSWIGWLKL